MSHRRVLTPIVATVTAIGLAVGLGACSAPDDSAASSSSVAAEPNALPVTIDHRYGDTTIDATAARIATLGPGDGDTLLALGITPTTMVPFSDPTEKTVIAPWNEKMLEGKEPVVLGQGSQDLSSSIPKALATDPDLILAVNNSVTRAQYDNLAKVAPTVVRPEQYQDWTVPWTASTTEIGRAVGKPAETAKLIADTQKRFADAKAANPQLAGRTGAVVIGSAGGGLSIYSPGDGRGQMLTNLGLTFPASLEPSITNGFYGSISDENLGLLGGLDKLVVVDWQGASDALRANPAFMNLDVVKRGDVVFLDQVTGSAMSVPTVLTIPWVLQKLVPQLAS
ncbi:ABC transporter substrate-binding protein [Williamsia sp. M5A3_1d]